MNENKMTDKIAENLSNLRIQASSCPEMGQERNYMLDDAIMAVRDGLELTGLSGQLFCARAHYGTRCETLKDIDQ